MAAGEHLEPQALDYSGALAKLLGMVGEQVEVAMRGEGRDPPLFADFEGELREGEQIGTGGELVGWGRDALRLVVGTVTLTLHPDHFKGATYSEDERGLRLLTVAMGDVEILLRADHSQA